MTISSLSSTASTSALQDLTNRRPRPPGGGAMDVAAKTLGLSTSDLMSQLKDGSSLGEIADAQGVSRDDLASALKAGAPQDLQSSSDVDAVISSMIDRVGLPQGGPQGPPPGPPPGAMSGLGSIDASTSGIYGSSLTSDQQSMLDNLSTVLGTDSTTLLAQLKSGTSLSDLLSTSGATKDDLASVLQNGLLFDARA